MKKKTLIAVIAGAVILTAGGGYGIFRLVKNNASPVEVTKVSSLNTGWWGNGIPTSGIITSNATQDVYLDNDEVVDKVHVKEGDQVEIGDKLISYDTTLLKLDLESEQLERQSVEARIKSAEQDLDKLKKITPIPDGMYGDAGEGGALIKKDVVMTAAKGKSSEKKKTDTKKEKEKQKNNSPLSKIKAFTKLDYKSEPYKGKEQRKIRISSSVKTERRFTPPL